MSMETQASVPTFWTTGYLPNGAKISFTVPILSDPYAEALAFTNRLLQSGFLLTEPGLEKGEFTETVHLVGRRVKINDDGSETPLLDFYSERLKWKLFHLYLNTPEDVAAFERACGVRLGSIPLNEDAQGAITRGKNLKIDAKYLSTFPMPVQVVMKPNPEYNPDEEDTTKKKPKNLFVRWNTTGNVIPVDTEPAPAKVAGASEEEVKAAMAAKSDLNGHGPKVRTIAPPEIWTWNTGEALRLIEAAMKRTGKPKPEVRNTVNKLYGEGVFEGMTKSQVFQEVLNRLASHDIEARAAGDEIPFKQDIIF